MKSSWQKQRLATKKRSIKLMKWKNNFIRKYRFRGIAEFCMRCSEAARTFAEAYYSVLKSIKESRQVNEVAK